MIIMQNYTKLPRFSRFILLPAVCNIEITRATYAMVTDDVGVHIQARCSIERAHRRWLSGFLSHHFKMVGYLIVFAPRNGVRLTDRMNHTKRRFFSRARSRVTRDAFGVDRIVRRYCLSLVSHEESHSFVHTRACACLDALIIARRREYRGSE